MDVYIIVRMSLKENTMIKAVLKRIMPAFVLSRWRQYKEEKERRRLGKLRQDVINYLSNIPPQDMTDEKRAVFNYLKCHPLSLFPYSFTEKHNPEDVIVYLDAEKVMYYILQDDKRLYFKKGWDKQQVQTYYNGLLIEQDALSPHRYETAGFHVSEGEVVVDAGAAEGNFALSVIEKVKKIYLFEVDKDWIAPLEATFAPFGNKVHVINSYVSDVWWGWGKITLDKFFEHKKVDLIKADIEGAETQLLRGAKTIL